MSFLSPTRARWLWQRILEEPARAWRYSWFLVSGWIYPRYKRRTVTLFLGAGGGFGDNLLLTAVAREVRKRNPKGIIHVITNKPVIFDRNPDVDFVSLRPRDKSRFRRFFILYSQGYPWKKHLLEYFCDCVNIPGSVELRTYVYPSPQDEAWADGVLADLPAAPILIHRTSNSHGFRKTWPVGYWKQLLEKLAPAAPIVEVGKEGEPLEADGTRYRSLLGQTTPHQLAALMGKAQALISVDSGPMHLAAAVGLPTVCILGGVFPPEALRYPNTTVLTDRPPCRDCWPLNHCDFEVKCMSNIKVEEVLSALKEVLGKSRKQKVESRDFQMGQAEALKC